MNENVKRSIEKALSLVGQGYIYGAKGQICSPAFRQQQAEQYPDQAERILGDGARWDGVPVWDCAQLTRAVAKESGVSLVSGATSQWNKTDWAERGTIDTMPEGEPMFLYRRQNGSSTVMQHTGVAIGDGTCVHARGAAYGVVRQNMADYPWTHWAVPREWREEEKEMPAMNEATIYNIPQNETANLRSRPDRAGAVVTRIPFGARIQAAPAENGWCSAMYDGMVGFVMADYVSFAGSVPDTSVILNLSAEAAAELAAALRKAGVV